MKFLVVGGGSIGRRHIRNLAAMEAGEIAACETQPERQALLREQFGIPVFSALTEALRIRPTAVLICTPPAFHQDVARAAVEAGCHLFIEKPISHTLDGLDQLVRTTEELGLVTLVGYNWRFHPSFQKMKEWIDQGEVGKILCARVNCGQYLPDWHPWEDYRQGYSASRALGGGILLDSHELDYITWLLGPVESIACGARKLSALEIETEDTADVVMVFSGGAQAALHLDYLQRPGDRSYELYGSEGTIRWSLQQGLAVYRAASGAWEACPEPAGFDLNCTYLEELRHFLACIRGEAKPLVDARRGKYVLELILAAKRSAGEGAVVPMDEAGRGQ